ncbi:MAG TPA: hypothetical protein VNO17_05630 [Actinomycetota bacterium]|nr:hypothetical protein [Actinomycetota bacterium]
MSALLGRPEVQRLRQERGAVGWLILGIVIGVILVIWAIVALIVPGD